MAKEFDVELVLVGDELLKGERRDAHVAFLGASLLQLGVRVGGAHFVGDDRAQIARAVGASTKQARVVVVSGGLGPTHDDITREGVADAVKLPLEFDEEQWQVIQDIFAKFGRTADESNRQQAYFPKGAEPIANANGTAAGFTVERDGSLVVVLPGPPRELIPMWENVVAKRIDRIFERPALYRETFRTTGIGESAMTSHVQPIYDAHQDVFGIASLPHIGGVDIVITQKPDVTDRELVEQKARTFEKELRDYLGHRLYAKGDASLEEVIGDALVEQGATLAIAESLTGGYLGKRITDVPGSSRYLLADIVAYNNEAKVEFLGVSQKTLDEHGAVSGAVCQEMAHGVRRKTGATYALATTGIAGPTGGSKEKPVGLTYYGLSWDGGQEIRHSIFPGDRAAVRERVNYATLLLLHEKLQTAG